MAGCSGDRVLVDQVAHKGDVVGNLGPVAFNNYTFGSLVHAEVWPYKPTIDLNELTEPNPESPKLSKVPCKAGNHA